jgi:nucleotide-binding universal stress UspA family protein
MVTPTQTQVEVEETLAFSGYRSILLAVDSSDHSNRAIEEAVSWASLWNARVTGTHVYAAKLHDLRFRQMEGGLPEQYRVEDELERQRDVHDDLITRGLSIITDSYLDQVEKQCDSAGLDFNRRSLEGKNYRELVNETNGGDYDLLILGSLGLGAVAGSRLGTVCGRVVRRSETDTLVVKQPERTLSDGPIIVAVDGSPKSYGGLLTALELGRKWGVKVQVVAAFDPYYHYVAFNRIAGVLSEEAGKVFRFKDQEKLHEDIIDSGLAKIYQGHLTVAESIAQEIGVEVETVLLDGKPHDAITKHVEKINPSLLVIGKLGIHADPELDIGGNAEHLLADVSCAVLLSYREHRPKLDLIADVTTTWTEEAETRMDRVPSFVRPMARMAILRYAQEQGHTVITEKIVEEATAELCPSHAEEAMEEIVAAHDAGELKGNKEDHLMRWTDDATAMLKAEADLSVRGNLAMRAEKKARTDGAELVAPEHVRPFVAETAPAPEPGVAAPEANTAAPEPGVADTATLPWQAAALARLMRVPEGFMRDTSRERVEDYARAQGVSEITLEVAEDGLSHARAEMERTMREQAASKEGGGKCPFGHDKSEPEEAGLNWTPAAEVRMEKVPEGFMRDLTRKRVTEYAKRLGLTEVSDTLIDKKYAEWEEGSSKEHTRMEWAPELLERIDRIPSFVRGMVIKEVERCASDRGATSVGEADLQAAMGSWERMGAFHQEGNPDLYRDTDES